jgi:hypothetical protein
VPDANIIDAGESKMDYGKTPAHVCFKAEFPPQKKAKKELFKIFETHLHAHANALRTKKWMKLWARWGAVLDMGDNSFTVILGRSQWDPDEWLALIAPNNVSSDISYLKSICREIHAFLTQTTGISDIRWYFQRGQHQSNTVGAPDELPWENVESGRNLSSAR